MSRQEKTKSGSFLESWFTKKTSQSTALSARPLSDYEGDETMRTKYNQMSPDDVDKEFEVFLNDMNLSEDKRKPLQKMPLEQKRNMLLMNQRQTNKDTGQRFEKPAEIKDYIIKHMEPGNLDTAKLLNCIVSLRIALTNNSLRWVQDFGEDGVHLIYRVTAIANQNKEEKLQLECLRCLEKVMDNVWGIKVCLSTAKTNYGLKLVAACLDPQKPNLMIQALKILAVICLIEEEKCLSALTEWAEQVQIERFQPVVRGIKSGNADLQCYCFQFINALLSQTEDFEFRVHLRNEIVRNGLQDQMADLKSETNPIVKTQFQAFEDMREQDADELHERFDKVRLDMDDMNDCFEVLKNTTLDTPAEPFFLSILQHLLFVRDDVAIRPAYFKIVEECVSQIVLHKSGLDPDFKKNHVSIDLTSLVEELKEKPIQDNTKMEELRKKLEDALTENSELQARLELLKSGGATNPNQGKLDPELVGKVKIPPPPAPPMPGGGGGPPPPPLPPGMMGGPPPPPMPGMGGGPPPPPMPGMGGMGPPPPPLPGMGPPPPPPFGGGLMAPPPRPLDLLPHGLKPKKKWESKGLKRANWKTILPQKLSEKSFWVKVKEEQYADPDILDGLAQKFSSKPPTKNKMEDVPDKSGNPVGTLKKVKELKVLDSKMAQNLLIFLGGSLKHVKYDQIKSAILRCDDTILDGNVIEQMIQYLPPPDQLQKLQTYKDNYKDLTEAEQFCVKISEIKRLLPRLKSLSFRNRYPEMVADTKPEIFAATQACEEVKRSPKFGKMLEFILLMGNYMNSGSKNEQAFAFEMNFLTKLKNTKDIHNRQTLLHYIADSVSTKYPELVDFYEEMPHIDRASRVSLEQIQKTLRQMDAQIKNLHTDLENNKVGQGTEDRFHEVMTPFSQEARNQCDVLQNMCRKMDALYSELAEYYAFDKQKYPLEEFFTDLKTFKDHFIEAQRDNDKERELEEKKEKARIAKEKQEKEKQERENNKRRLIDMNQAETQEGVMDSLLEALSSGSAFGRDQKRKRGHRPAGAERRAQLQRSRSRTGIAIPRELSEILAA